MERVISRSAIAPNTRKKSNFQKELYSIGARPVAIQKVRNFQRKKIFEKIMLGRWARKSNCNFWGQHQKLFWFLDDWFSKVLLLSGVLIVLWCLVGAVLPSQIKTLIAVYVGSVACVAVALWILEFPALSAQAESLKWRTVNIIDASRHIQPPVHLKRVAQKAEQLKGVRVTIEQERWGPDPFLIATKTTRTMLGRKKTERWCIGYWNTDGFDPRGE